MPPKSRWNERMGMLVLFEDVHAGRETRAGDLTKAQLFYELGKGPVTRKRLAGRLRIRPTTVSTLVGEMVAAGLVAEGNADVSARKGRPGIPLEIWPSRVSVPVHFTVPDLLRGCPPASPGP